MKLKHEILGTKNNTGPKPWNEVVSGVASEAPVSSVTVEFLSGSAPILGDSGAVLGMWFPRQQTDVWRLILKAALGLDIIKNLL